MRKRKYPKCNSNNLIPIIYGMPGIDLVEKENKGEIKFGGCIVMPDSPKWYCEDCKSES